MKNMIVLAVLLSVAFAACTPESPRVRVQNQNSEIADVAIKPPSGSTINLNDVSAGNETSYIEVPASNYEVDVHLENISSKITTHFRAYEDESYTIVVSNTVPPVVTVKQ